MKYRLIPASILLLLALTVLLLAFGVRRYGSFDGLWRRASAEVIARQPHPALVPTPLPIATIGPNRTALFGRWPLLGLSQVLADGIKSFLKEDLVPPHAVGVLFWLAPMLAFLPAALGFAVMVVLAAEPWIRSLVCGAMGIRTTAFVAASPFSADARWLFLVAAAIAIAFSVAGVTIPAAWACRLSPVEALRRRE